MLATVMSHNITREQVKTDFSRPTGLVDFKSLFSSTQCYSKQKCRMSDGLTHVQVSDMLKHVRWNSISYSVCRTEHLLVLCLS